MSSIPVTRSSNPAGQVSFLPLPDSNSLYDSTARVTHEPYLAPSTYRLRCPDLVKVIDKFDPNLVIVSNHLKDRTPQSIAAVEKIKDSILNTVSQFHQFLQSLRSSSQQGKARLESMAFGRSHESPSKVIQELSLELDTASGDFSFIADSFRVNAKKLEIAVNTPPTKLASWAYWLLNYNVPAWAGAAGPVLGVGSAVMDLQVVVRLVKGISDIEAGLAFAAAFFGIFLIMKAKCEDYEGYKTIEKAKKSVAAMKTALDELDQEAFKELEEYWSNFSKYLRLVHERAQMNPSHEQLLALSEDMDKHTQELDYLISKLVYNLPVVTPDQSVKASRHPKRLPKPVGRARLPLFFETS